MSSLKNMSRGGYIVVGIIMALMLDADWHSRGCRLQRHRGIEWPRSDCQRLRPTAHDGRIAVGVPGLQSRG